MENDPRWPPPPKIWDFPYVSSFFFLKASLRTELQSLLIFSQLLEEQWDFSLDSQSLVQWKFSTLLLKFLSILSHPDQVLRYWERKINLTIFQLVQKKMEF